MINIPWRPTKLSEVLEPISRAEPVDPVKEYRLLGIRLDGGGAFHRETKRGSQIAAKTLSQVRTGDFIYSRLFAWRGAFGVIGAELDGCYVSGEFPTFMPVPGKLDVQFLRLWFCLPTTISRVEADCAGSTPLTRNRFKEHFFLAMEIPLPPVTEQRRIVTRIDELAAKIDEARNLRQQAMQEANGVPEATGSRLLAGVDASITELRSWLDRNGDGIQTGPFGAQLGSVDFVESGIPVLTIGNVQYGGLKLDDLKRVSEEKARRLDRYRIKSGDILFARMGTVGRCCIVPEEAEGWLINYHIIRVALDKSRVEPRYIHWIIRASAEVEKYLDEKIRGATRQGVNSAIVGSLPCRVPPINEQRRIVAYLDDVQAKVDALKQLQAETTAELDALLPSILDKAFKGEL
ncbi:MAG: restriction endonuclease subunit S [Candidatus Methylomirabilales bacterium]